MELYVGGCFQGKQRYVCEKKQIKKEEFMDETVFGHCKTEAEWVKYCSQYKGINHVHLLIRQLLEQGINSKTFLEQVIEKNPDVILICDEVGYGIVPFKKGRSRISGSSRTNDLYGSAEGKPYGTNHRWNWYGIKRMIGENECNYF